MDSFLQVKKMGVPATRAGESPSLVSDISLSLAGPSTPPTPSALGIGLSDVSTAVVTQATPVGEGVSSAGGSECIQELLGVFEVDCKSSLPVSSTLPLLNRPKVILDLLWNLSSRYVRVFSRFQSSTLQGLRGWKRAWKPSKGSYWGFESSIQNFQETSGTLIQDRMVLHWKIENLENQPRSLIRHVLNFPRMSESRRLY